MNHTIKGILIAAAITSMLIVGATMIPIMQNSFAKSEVKKTHEVKKAHDFKKAQRNTDKNINVNTNSADSSSSSNATAENTNNIDNTATATQSQEQNACAVAVTCPGGTTTVTPPPIAGCPVGTLYDITTGASTVRGIPGNTELCLPKTLGEQTATVAGTSTTIRVVIANPDEKCPTGTVFADVTSGAENVRFTSVCVHLPGTT
jgi:hypothetical protein